MRRYIEPLYKKEEIETKDIISISYEVEDGQEEGPDGKMLLSTKVIINVKKLL